MIGRVIEVATDGAHLSVDRGFMTVSHQKETLGRVAIADISALIVRGYGATISLNLASRLSQSGIPTVLCDSNQSPSTLLWPIKGHFEQGRRMQAQAEASRPLRKRLWRDIVVAKISAQAYVLKAVQESPERLKQYARSVKSGDPDNIEGQAARYYWPRLFGETFRRNRSEGGQNAALNYGYTVLRAATARSILAAGLHPSLSVHHKSRGDALRLADDLMEPFRPYIDLTVHRMLEPDTEELTRDMKAKLAAVLTLDLEGPRGARPLQSCLDALVVSLAQIYTGEQKSLEIPAPPFGLDASGS
ncbi:type II CRISPR-associated endonuclease Cas1 [Hwanghaeella sp. LZ110]|uniref:type II CRISPR-associated endonuclease Cas1 n=1 Tax=Hwanghaeella sp. LZ110 TaxID=3402810 RepID=UPI003B6850A1